MMWVIVPVVPWSGAEERSVAVTFDNSRWPLGVEAQRQWYAQTIRFTTSALLGLFSLVLLRAHSRMAAPTAAMR